SAADKRWKSSNVFMIVMRRRRFLPGTPINTSWRCLEMSMATNKVEAVVSMAVIAGLLSGVVCAKPLLRPETRIWPPATRCEGCARGHRLKLALLPDVLWPELYRRRTG